MEVINECSYGIVPAKKTADGWQLLMVCHRKGHWSFPKGHAEAKETPYEAACRELHEETALRIIQLLHPHPLEERYTFEKASALVAKQVFYFVAEVAGHVHLQEKELSDFLWIDYREAHHLATFQEGQELCKSIEGVLNKLR